MFIALFNLSAIVSKDNDGPLKNDMIAANYSLSKQSAQSITSLLNPRVSWVYKGIVVYARQREASGRGMLYDKKTRG